MPEARDIDLALGIYFSPPPAPSLPITYTFPRKQLTGGVEEEWAVLLSLCGAAASI